MPRSPLRAVLCVCLCSLVASGFAEATQNDPAAPSTIFSFDIDAQPVASALEFYSAVTGIQVVYDGTLVFGRMSRPIRGTMSSGQALDDLLEGTGLSAGYGAPNVSTLVPRAPPQSARQPLIDVYMPYLGIVQNAVEEAFCRQIAIAPGSYHARLRFWIGLKGRLLSPQLLEFQGDAARELAMLAALQEVAFDRAPPTDMPQPVVMEISRRSPRETGDCGGWHGQDAKMQKAASP